jgi:hypothetical protein
VMLTFHGFSGKFSYALTRFPAKTSREHESPYCAHTPTGP